MLNRLIGWVEDLELVREQGQDLAEYSLFIGLIALVVVISITLIGTEISDIFMAIAEGLTTGF